MEAGKEVEKKPLRDIVDFMRIFSDKCHHGKEKNSLVPCPGKEGRADALLPSGSTSRRTSEGKSVGFAVGRGHRCVYEGKFAAAGIDRKALAKRILKMVLKTVCSMLSLVRETSSSRETVGLE